MARALFVLLVAYSIPCATTFAQDNSAKSSGTIEVLSQFGGVIRGVSIYEGKAYVGEGRELVVYDISGSTPVEIGRTEPMPYSISAIDTGNGLASVASGNELRLYYISNMTVPFFLGSLTCDSAINDIEVNGWMAYLGTLAGLRIVDNSRYRPELSGSYSTDQILDVAVDGTTVYMSSYFDGLDAVDCSIPNDPVLLASYTSTASGTTYLAAQDGFVYFMDRGEGIKVATLSTQNTFTILNTLTDFTYCSFCKIDGNRLYVGIISPGRLQTFDITTPGSPSALRGYPYPISMSGLAASNGKILTTHNSGLGFLDESSPGSPTFLDTLPLGESVMKTVIHDEYAYVLTQNGFHIFDISNLSGISLVHETEISGCTDIAVADHVAIISTTDGFTIYDCTNPSSPSYLTDNPMGSINNILFERGYLFATTNNAVYSFDIHNPSLPVLLDQIYLSHIRNMELNNNLLYVSRPTNDTLFTLDVSDPANLTLVNNDYFYTAIKHLCRDDKRLYIAGNTHMGNSWLYPGRSLFLRGYQYFNNTISDIAASNRRAIVATDAPEMIIVDVSTPEKPAILDTIPCTQTPTHTTLTGNILFAAEGNSVLIYDLNQPEAQLFPSAGTVYSLALRGDSLFTASTGSVTAVNISDPAHPQTTSNLTIDLGSSPTMSCTSTHALLSDHMSGLHIVDISDPDDLMRVGGYSGLAYCSDTFAGNGYAYSLWSSDSPELQALDLTHPNWPVLAGGVSSEANAILGVEGNKLWLMISSTTTIEQYDISNPEAPSLEGQFSTFSRVRSLAASGNYLYLAAERTGLLVYDMSNPAEPTLVTTYASPSFYCYELTLEGNRLYAKSGYAFTVLDISDPENPVRIGQHVPAFAVGAPVIRGDLAFIANGSSGVTILQLPDQYLDEDGDGVLNTEDQCPGSLIPAESADEFGCLAGVNGDSDQDGDVDLADYAAFQRCYGEYSYIPESSSCMYTFDKAGDRIIDEEDFELFESLFTGPQQ